MPAFAGHPPLLSGNGMGILRTRNSLTLQMHDLAEALSVRRAAGNSAPLAVDRDCALHLGTLDLAP
jgi:hypothetical protein